MSLENVARGPPSNIVSNGALGHKQGTLQRSLIISPNLDALLEHEERARQGVNVAAEPISPESYKQQISPRSVSPSVDFPIGLPPPPRRTRGPKSALAASHGMSLVAELPLPEAQGWENQESMAPIPISSAAPSLSSSTSNPYINPAPTLDQVLGARKGTRREERSKGDSSSRSRDGSMATDGRDLPCKQQSVDNTLISLIISQDDRGQIPSRNKHISKVSVPHMRQANRVESGPVSQGYSTPPTDSVVSATTTPWQRRPLISHAHRSSVSSADSTSTSSTDGPPSTAEHEPRISISSTIYPASSSHSNSHSLYNDMSIHHRHSFMDLYSPTNTEFNVGTPTTSSSEPSSPLQFAPYNISQFSVDNGGPSSATPPIPTTPKPLFALANLRSRQSSPKSSPPPSIYDQQKAKPVPLPPTTNFLDVEERADLIRKSRKLARVFGQTPGAEAMAQQDSGRSAHNTFLASQRRGSALASNLPLSAWRSDTSNLYTARRHSMPLSPDNVSFLSILSPTLEDHPSSSMSNLQIDTPTQVSIPSSDPPAHHATPQIRSASPPTSFIDLSDDALDEAKLVSIKPTAEKALPKLPSEPLFDSMSVDQAEEERRRKRERLAKLHRFLGSQVPAHLVLGIEDMEASLPPPQAIRTLPKSPTSESEDTSRKAWLRRRRSSSAAILFSSRPEEPERIRQELDDKEKAINVRRAQKMEKVFGVAPPQTLYHTRHSPSLSVLPVKQVIPRLIPSTFVPPMEMPSPPAQRNPNRTSYIKTKPKKNNRPGTAESSKQLLPKGPASIGFDDRLAGPATAAHSVIYSHYQQSLNSLNDILDRDDRESLAELHQYLTVDHIPIQHAEEDKPSGPSDRRMSVGSSIKSERRRSLPGRTSMISLASEYTIPTPKAEITSFQMRRRRAAKLSQFFGVDYHELLSDVLESIENGVEVEQERGTLRAEEVQDLLAKLRKLKSKPQRFL